MKLILTWNTFKGHNKCYIHFPETKITWRESAIFLDTISSMRRLDFIFEL